ncbi:uncharacterized protein LOC141830630 [Curcuma longa]|uniref:uncharacterized protein LOC141830630 n=1 Tax=Curcuma longa TaxID=136217 RepID=UPI003D9E900E
MASQLIEEQRRGAEIRKGHGACWQRLVQLLEDELSLPEGILPLEDIEELGYNRASGFVWLSLRKKKNHMFQKIKQLVSFGTEVTGFIEDRKLKRITGIKARELLIWLTVKQVGVDEQSTEKVVMLTTTGLSKSFPKSAFDLEP